MSLVEVVRTPSGEAYCLEAYSLHSIGGWLRHVEHRPGEWRIEVFRWPPSLRREPRWSTVVASKAEAEDATEKLITLLEAGAWSPRQGDDPPL